MFLTDMESLKFRDFILPTIYDEEIPKLEISLLLKFTLKVTSKSL